jgi:hypothetical protein
LASLGKTWSEPLHEQALRTNTHDLGFMIQPSMRPRWELLHDETALATIVQAARSLYSRYSDKVRAVRSWNLIEQEGVQITDMETNFLCIIDSMCNMDLLFYAAAQTGQSEMASAATQHAHTLIREGLVRREQHRHRDGYSGMLYSTFHVINLDQVTGRAKQLRTRQGYGDDSTWARGQAWGVLGYAQTYMWTGDKTFLDAACGLVEYFLLRLEDAPSSVERDVVSAIGGTVRAGRYVPLWDFDAPVEAEATAAGPLRDSSAGVIAANGMLVLSQAFAGQGEAEKSKRYLDAALTIVQDTLTLCLAPEKAQLVSDGEGNLSGRNVEDGRTFEAILKHATVNHNTRDFRRYWDHGLVYADWFLIEFGNRLLRLGLTNGQAFHQDQKTAAV